LHDAREKDNGDFSSSLNLAGIGRCASNQTCLPDLKSASLRHGEREGSICAKLAIDNVD